MSDRAKCFVAYPAQPSDRAESIETAMKAIHDGGIVDVELWTDLASSGRLLMPAICEAIDHCDIFVCDLTGLNENVLFELGYAIAKDKRIWPVVNEYLEGAKDEVARFKALRSIGYAGYTNSKDIEDSFYEEEPYRDLASTVFSDTIEPSLGSDERDSLLYVKSPHDTDASVKLSRLVDEAVIPSIVDDPKEVEVQSFSWYSRRTWSSFAMVTHLLANNQRGARDHNRKASFASGLGYGFSGRILILAHTPYRPPVDYDELLVSHRTATDCAQAAERWLTEVQEAWRERSERAEEHRRETLEQNELARVDLGEPVAENERQGLKGYFIETGAYHQAVDAKTAIFVGRRGSGKTANLYQLAEHFRDDVRNHVSVIKPVAYELEGVLDMLRQTMARAVKGYLVESLWKFLIYSELLRDINRELSDEPAYVEFTDEQERLREFVDSHNDIVEPEFSVRLEAAVQRLSDIDTSKGTDESRQRISELLHGDFLPKARAILGEVLSERERVVVLIDNLDKPWQEEHEVPELSRLLYGLLDVSQQVTQDFEKSDSWREPVDFSLLIFLRSDIYIRIIQYARERDKIPTRRIAWDDEEMLLRVLEQRFLNAAPDAHSRNEIWEKFFADSVKGVPTPEYLVQRIIPRPRDLIYFAQESYTQAVNRGHTQIAQEDILAGEKEYSQYALDSISVENEISARKIEALLYEFVGLERVVSETDIVEAMERAGLDREELPEVIMLLFERTFLGLETRRGEFDYLHRVGQAEKLLTMATRVAEDRNPERWRFEIHPAFRAYLEVKEEGH